MTDGTTTLKQVKPKLQVSNGYDVEFDQITRILDASCQDERPRSYMADLAEKTGLALRQVENYVSIANALGLTILISLKPTPLARLLLTNDRFFDDVGTLWYLHYVIGSEPKWMVWNYFTNVLIPRHQPFTRNEFRQSFAAVLSGHGASGQQHVDKETKTVTDAYINQQFSKLAYLRQQGDTYSLSYCLPVPPLVLAASIARFRDRHRPGETAISISDLLTAPNSPGTVFQLPEDRLRSALEQLRREAGLSLESRADLDQIRLTDTTPDHAWMERYYASR